MFEYSATGDLKISFIYDYRQKATDALRKIGIVISDDRSTYELLKAKYNSLVVSYNSDKVRLDALIAAYGIDKIAYEKDVNYWNSHGRMTKAEYNSLEQRRVDLSDQVTAINQTRDSLNGLVDTINSAEIVLNKLAVALNLKVNMYNTVGSSAGKQFNEGEFVSDASGTAINIYQFNDTNQLVRVLTHELGYALGLGHLNNLKAVMYYLNEEGMNEKLTTDDLTALKKVCGIK